MLQPADSLYIGEGMNLLGEVGVAFYVRRSILDRLEEEGPAWKFYASGLIPDAVKSPAKIFGGLNRPEFENAYCYCSRQDKTWKNSTEQVDVAPELLFVVYAEKISGGFVVIDWGWRPEDKQKPGYPNDWEDFERGQVWPSI
jgi:hypothetical protein